MKVQEILKQKIEKLNKFVEIVSYIPDNIELSEYSSEHATTIKGEMTLAKCLGIVRKIREASGFASKLEAYNLAHYYDEKWSQHEAIRLSYRFSELENLDGGGFLVRFTVKNPSASLRKLGLKCRIKTVTTEARFIKATSSREIVCPVS